MEWMTESGEVRAPAPGNGNAAEPVQAPAPAMSSPTSTGYERCSSCGSLVAVDQRYCLECGRRRGEPRLPFMDAVVFMDAMNRPADPPAAPKKEKRRRLSPNTALIAGVGTLLLALGIGVLIGRSGDHGTTPAAAPPQIVTVGGGEEATANASAKGTETVRRRNDQGQVQETGRPGEKKAAETGEGAKEVLHAVPGVNLPPPTIKVGGKCEKGRGLQRKGRIRRQLLRRRRMSGRGERLKAMVPGFATAAAPRRRPPPSAPRPKTPRAPTIRAAWSST